MDYKPYMVWTLTTDGWIVTNSLFDPNHQRRVFMFWKQYVSDRKTIDAKQKLNLKSLLAN